MKTKNLTIKILLTFSFLLLSTVSFAQWQIQSSTTTQDLNSVYFADNEHGWIVGEEGTILHTDNGGDTWNNQTSGTDFSLLSVHFIDAENGWIAGWAGWNTPQSGGIILRTSNGGTNWEEVFTDSLYRVKDVFFSDQENGWAVGLGVSFWFWCSTILHTNDGGETWNIQDSLSYGNLKSIHFIDANTGWIVGGGYQISSNTPYRQILHTNNGGINWEEQINCINVAPINSVCFTDTENGWAVGTNRDMFPKPTIFHTVDGGNHWDSLLYVGSNGPTYSLESVCFIDTNNGWAVGGRDWIVSQEFNIILHTSNGGDSWEEQPCGTTLMLNSVCFTDLENGWIVGGGGTILHTDNGGITKVEKHQCQNSKFQIINYPNPFSKSTTIEYELAESGTTEIKIYNQSGYLVEVIILEESQIGRNKFIWQANTFPSGIYFIRLQVYPTNLKGRWTGNDFITKKVIKLK